MADNSRFEVRPGLLPRGQHTPWVWVVLIAAIILFPVLWFIGAALLDPEPKKPAPQVHAARTIGKSPLRDWKPNHAGAPEPEPINGVPTIVEVKTPAAPDTGKDALIADLTSKVNELSALVESLRQTPAAKPTTDPDAEERKAAAKKRAEERRKEDDEARKTLVAWLAPPKDGQTQRVGFSQPSGQYMLIQGRAKANCILETALNSDIPAPVVAKITTPVYDSVYGDAVLIPPESTVNGVQRGQPIFGEQRVPLAFSSLSYPNGGRLTFGKEIQGLDGEGRGGLTGEVNNHWGRLLASVVVTSVLRGGAQTLSGMSGGVAERIEGELAREGAQEGTQRTKRFLNSNPTITAPAGSPCLFILDQDIAFPARAVEAIP